MPNDTYAILCPVDFSDLSSYALRYAAKLARCRQTRIVAFHTTWWEAPPYFTPARVATLQKEFREAMGEAEQILRQFVGRVLDADGVGVETRILEALPADGILRTAAENRASLIIMGTHGRSGWNRFTLGSVTERVLRESAVPVLTVRQAMEQPIRRILCPVSDTPESRHALTLAAEYGACLDATVTALHVRESLAAAAIPDLCAWIPATERSRCSIREVVRQGNAAEEIIKLAAEEHSDLLVIGAPRRRFFEGMLLGTTTIRTVRHAPCPVLTVSAAPA